MIDVPLLYKPIRNHYFIQKDFGKVNWETNQGNQDDDKDVPDILSDMLTKYQMHKENDDHAHENVISKNEILLLVSAINIKDMVVHKWHIIC